MREPSWEAPAVRYPDPLEDGDFCPTCDAVRERLVEYCVHCGVHLDSPPPNVVSLCVRRQTRALEREVRQVRGWLRSRGLL